MGGGGGHNQVKHSIEPQPCLWPQQYIHLRQTKLQLAYELLGRLRYPTFPLQLSDTLGHWQALDLDSLKNKETEREREERERERWEEEKRWERDWERERARERAREREEQGQQVRLYLNKSPLNASLTPSWFEQEIRFTKRAAMRPCFQDTGSVHH